MKLISLHFLNVFNLGYMINPSFKLMIKLVEAPNLHSDYVL